MTELISETINESHDEMQVFLLLLITTYWMMLHIWHMLWYGWLSWMQRLLQNGELSYPGYLSASLTGIMRDIGREHQTFLAPT